MFRLIINVIATLQRSQCEVFFVGYSLGLQKEEKLSKILSLLDIEEQEFNTLKKFFVFFFFSLVLFPFVLWEGRIMVLFQCVETPPGMVKGTIP